MILNFNHENSLKVNILIYTVLIYTEKINFYTLYTHILEISYLIVYFAKFYSSSQTQKSIAINYFELKSNEFFVQKLQKLISQKQMIFLELKCKY